MLGVKVEKKDAEKVRRDLKKLGVLDTTKKVIREDKYVIFPVKRRLKNYTLVEREFEDLKSRKSFEDLLSELLDDDKLSLVRHSFDIVGDIAIIEVPPELESVEEKIAKALLLAHRNIKAVYKKSSEVMGEERVRKLKFISGVRKTETVHKEHGVRLKLDITKVYFSPRLSYERERILKQTMDGEVIVDMFAGVGPFSILLAKYRKVKVYAIDKNPHAYSYLVENIKLNKVEDRVIPLLGDCREVSPRGIASRVIMNLPKTSHLFLDTAFEIIKEGIIHFYSISPEEDLFEGKIDLLHRIADKNKRKIKIEEKRIVRAYSPRKYHIVIDVRVKK